MQQTLLLNLICVCVVQWFCHFSLECNEPIIVTSDFLKQPGEVSIIAQYSFYKTDHFWNQHGQRRKAYNRLRQNVVDLYAEYGVTKGDTLGLYSCYVNNEEKLNHFSRGVGDIELCWKRFFVELGCHTFAWRLIGVIPVGERKTTVRYGEWGVELDLHAQHDFCFQNRWGWYEVLAGYRYYHGFPSDQLKFYAVAGYQLLSRLTAIGGLYFDYGVYNSSKGSHGPVLTLPPRYRLLKAELHGVFCVAQYVSIFAGGFQHLWGEHIGTGGGFFAGLWIDF